MSKKILIILFLCLTSIVLSLVVYFKDDKKDDKKGKSNIKSIKLYDSSIVNLSDNLDVINKLISYIFVPVLTSLNINNTININQDIPPISINVNKDGGVFKLSVSAKTFSVIINNVKDINISFMRYSQGKLEFYTIIPCILNIGSMSFTNMSLLGTQYADSNFTNIQIPFSIQITLLFDPINYSNSNIIIDKNLAEISLPDSMRQYWDNYWNTRSNDALTGCSSVVTSLYYCPLYAALNLAVIPIFWGQVNENANLSSQIGNQLPAIQDTINTYLTSIDSQFLNTCSQYSSLINIIAQINMNPWDFSKILCDSNECKSNSHRNYLLVTTNNPFSGTNFPSNQIYVTKNDFTTCYAINMYKSRLELLQNTFPPIIDVSPTKPAEVLLKTNQTDGTVVIYPNIIGNWYSGDNNKNSLTFGGENETTLMLAGTNPSLTSGSYNNYNSSLTLFSTQFSINPIIGNYNLIYNLSNDTITIFGTPTTFPDGTTQNGLGIFHR